MKGVAVTSTLSGPFPKVYDYGPSVMVLFDTIMNFISTCLIGVYNDKCFRKPYLRDTVA